jgi:hypothetical protein
VLRFADMEWANRGCRLNVARLANVPESVIEVAAVKSRELEDDIKRRKAGKMWVLATRRLALANASRMQLAAKLRGDDKEAVTTLQRLVAGIEHLWWGRLVPVGVGEVTDVDIQYVPNSKSGKRDGRGIEKLSLAGLPLAQQNTSVGNVAERVRRGWKTAFEMGKRNPMALVGWSECEDAKHKQP